jgi:hypothetical protein
MLPYPRALFTVWRFESPTTGDVNIVARRAEPRDLDHTHTYQRILGQVWAYSRAEALASVKKS